MHDSSPADPEVLLAQAGWVRKLALHLVADPDRADDLVQETWQRAIERPIRPGEHGTSKRGLRSWLARVMRNLAIDTRRDASLRAWHERSAARPEEWSPEEIEERVRLQRRLAEAVLALDEPYRSAITLRYFEELSPREIARRQRITYDTARQRISRGIAMLRARLDHEHGGDRGAWCAALLSLVGRAKAPHPLSHWLPGGLIMGVNAKLFVSAAAALAVVSFLAWRVVRSEPDPRPEASLAGADAPALSGDSLRSVTAAPSAPSLSREAVSAEPHAGATRPGIDRDRDLHGEVMDASDRPIAEASIIVSRWDSSEYHSLEVEQASDRREVARATTDTSGSFAVPLPPGRAFDLEVDAEGFALEDVRDLHAGEHVTVHMSQGAALFGRITRAADGSAVAGASVSSGTARFRSCDGTTDADGRYRFENLSPRAIEVSVLPEIGLAPIRRRVELRAGESTELNLSLDGGATLRGRVVDAASRAPIANAEVGEGVHLRRSVRTDAQGEFAYPGFPTSGDSEIVARAEGYGRMERTLRILSTDAFPERVDFELGAARRARGRIVDARGAPLAGVHVTAAASAFEPGEQRTDWISGTSAADGRFELRGLRPDVPHALVARKEGFGTVTYDFPATEKESESIDLGDMVLPPMSILRGSIVDEGGSGIAGLEVTLRGANADRDRMSGSVRTAPELDSHVSRRTGRTDDLGRFGFADLAEGTYTIETRAKGWSEAHHVSRTVTLPRGGEVGDVKLVVDRGSSIEGRVVDADSRPVPRAFCLVQPENGDKGGISCTSDSEGRFTAPGLFPGDYRIDVRILDWSNEPEPRVKLAPANVSGIAAGRQDVVIVMHRAVSLRGRVLDDHGEPVARAFVSANTTGGPGISGGMTDTEGRFEIPVAEGDVVDLEAQPPTATNHPNVPFIPDQDPAHTGHVRGVVPGDQEIVIRLPGPR